MFKIILGQVVHKHLSKLSADIAGKIRLKVYEDLVLDSRKQGKALTGQYKGLYSYKCFKDYPVLYRISEVEKIITIVAISYRSEIYKAVIANI